MVRTGAVSHAGTIRPSGMGSTQAQRRRAAAAAAAAATAAQTGRTVGQRRCGLNVEHPECYEKVACRGINASSLGVPAK